MAIVVLLYLSEYFHSVLFSLRQHGALSLCVSFLPSRGQKTIHKRLNSTDRAYALQISRKSPTA
jgi:hypothetical protein